MGYWIADWADSPKVASWSLRQGDLFVSTYFITKTNQRVNAFITNNYSKSTMMDKGSKSYRNNYFDFQVYLRTCVQIPTPIATVVSQNVANKSCLVCVKSEKYAFLASLRPVGIHETRKS